VDLTPTNPQDGAGSPLSAWINQPILSTNLWNCDASVFKNFSIKEKARLRLQFDFFNVFNTPGNDPTTGGDGIGYTYYNSNPSGARTMQISARLSW
jgi:hypothetical protein